ncbi:MAG: hypothetical protein IH841_07080, partial [Thaumarchaeota archaeon]|nr:hypothetical protein [Nitrososphaerota archaeon]
MVVAYSSDTINKVKKLLLEGYSYTEISEKMGVSTAKISEVKNKFESELGKIDFETIREFSKIIKKNNISWSDLFSGNIITSYIKKLGIDLSTFESFVKNFYNECNKNNLESQKIIQYGEKLFLLEHQSGMSLEDLPEECQNLINEKESLEKEINQLNQDAEKSRNNTQTVLDENNLNIEKLNAFIKSKNILENTGISLGDYSKLATMFQNAKDNDYDLEKITTHLQKENNHEEQILEYQNQIKQLETQKEDQSEQNKILS